MKKGSAEKKGEAGILEIFLRAQSKGSLTKADMTGEMKYPSPLLGWSVWGLGGLLYLLGFYQRVAPAVMTSELMADFGTGAAGLGNLSASYYYSYVAMQVPTGLLADAWGPRRLLTTGAILASAGTFLFAWAPTLLWANLGRVLIGGAVGVAFVAVLKLAAHWLPPSRFAMASGLALFSGVLGAVTAGVPLRLLIDHMGWRPAMFASGGITLALAVSTWVFIRDDPSAKGFLSYGHAGPVESRGTRRISPLAGLGRIFRYRNTWFFFLAPGGLVGPILSFAGLWGVPFLQVRFGLTPAAGAAVCSALMVFWAVGGPILGGLSDRIGRRKPLYLAGCLVAAACWALALFIPGLPFWAFAVLMGVIGLASGGVMIGFAFSKESVPPNLAGTVAGVVNMGHMMAPTLLQPAIGWILDRMWTGEMLGGVRVYHSAAFQAGFSLMWVWSVLSCLFISLTKETYCRQLSPEREDKSGENRISISPGGLRKQK
jgi:MFS family permease